MTNHKAITKYEQEMHKLMIEITDKARSYPKSPLSPAEEQEYDQFVQAAVELMDEQYPPQGRPGSTTAIMDAEHIKDVLSRVKAHRLKRLFPMMAPETALKAADYINRTGKDRGFWR